MSIGNEETVRVLGLRLDPYTGAAAVAGSLEGRRVIHADEYFIAFILRQSLFESILFRLIIHMTVCGIDVEGVPGFVLALWASNVIILIS